MAAVATKYEPISTAANRPTSAATSCTRSGKRRVAAHSGRNVRPNAARMSVRRQPQDVADTTHRVDQARLDDVDLAAQVGDVRLDHTGLAVEVVPPDLVQDLRLGHD